MKKHEIAHKMIRLPKQEIVHEHEQLVKKLKSGKGLKQEAKKQSQELKEYKQS